MKMPWLSVPQTPFCSCGRVHSCSRAGSALVFVLFVCLSLAVMVASLAALVRLGHAVLLSEGLGSTLLERADTGLSCAVDLCLESWVPRTEHLPTGECVAIDSLPTGSDSRMTVQVSVPSVEEAGNVSAPLVVGAVAERGLDGLNLPKAALVAGRCLATDNRAKTPVCALHEGGLVPVFLAFPEASCALPCASVRQLSSLWQLDRGSRLLFEQAGQARGYRLSPGVVVLTGERGQVVRPLPSTLEEGHSVIAVVGGASLDLRDMGVLEAVVLCDGGSVLVEGTELGGAIFATEDVDFGATGCVVFEPSVLAKACYASLTRVRLLPGSRSERWLEVPQTQ